MNNYYQNVFKPKSKISICEFCKEEFTWDRGYNIRFCKKEECQEEKKRQFKEKQYRNSITGKATKRKKRVSTNVPPKPYKLKHVLTEGKSYLQIAEDSLKRKAMNVKKYGSEFVPRHI